MKSGFPVAQDKSLESEVYGHFGSAPLFIVVDTATGTAGAITNNNQHHAHGMCNPILALDNQHVDAIVVGGIGAGALNKLNASGIRVFQARAATVQASIELFAQRKLPEYTAAAVLRRTRAGFGLRSLRCMSGPRPLTRINDRVAFRAYRGFNAKLKEEDNVERQSQTCR